MFKKVIVGLAIGAMSVSAFAGQDIYLTFKDGTTATYKNIDDEVDNDGFNKMLMRDFRRSLNDVDHARSRIEDTPFWDTGLGTAIKWTAGTILLVAVVRAIPALSAGCQHYYDRAKDGSLCGKRSADYRPGGK